MVVSTHIHSGNDIPAQFLPQLIKQQTGGKIRIQNPFDEFVYWQIYFGDGRIYYANSSNGAKERINYLIGRTLNSYRITLPHYLDNDYDYLCDLWEKDIFTFQQMRSICSQGTQEALVQIFSLPKAQYVVDFDYQLNHIFLNLEIRRAILPNQHKIKYWWKLRSDINSPFQRPLVENWKSLQQVITDIKIQGPLWIKCLQDSLTNLNCLYEIASKTQMSTLQLALLLQPLVKTGEIKMLPYQDIEIDDRPLIILISQRDNQQTLVDNILKNNGFRVSVLDDPFKALTIALNQNPQLVLVDVDLPEMDGYQFCAFCRKSPQLKSTPIILLGRESGLVPTIRSKLCNASAYLSHTEFPLKLVDKIRLLTKQPRSNFIRSTF